MKTGLCSAFIIVGLTVSMAVGADAKGELEGIWAGQSMESDGKAAPEADAQRMRFTFKGEKLLVRGNFPGDREEECTYKIDTEKKPKHLDFTPAGEKKPVLAIYEIKGDELKVCLRHGSSGEGRPTEFATKADSKLVLIVLKKKKT